MGAVNILEHLETLRQKINDAKQEKAQIEGKLEAAYEQLKRDFDLEDEEAALKEIRLLQEEESKLEEELTADYAKLCEDYDI